MKKHVFYSILFVLSAYVCFLAACGSGEIVDISSQDSAEWGEIKKTLDNLTDGKSLISKCQDPKEAEGTDCPPIVSAEPDPEPPQFENSSSSFDDGNNQSSDDGSGNSPPEGDSSQSTESSSNSGTPTQSSSSSTPPAQSSSSSTPPAQSSSSSTPPAQSSSSSTPPAQSSSSSTPPAQSSSSSTPPAQSSSSGGTSNLVWKWYAQDLAVGTYILSEVECNGASSPYILIINGGGSYTYGGKTYTSTGWNSVIESDPITTGGEIVITSKIGQAYCKSSTSTNSTN